MLSKSDNSPFDADPNRCFGSLFSWRVSPVDRRRHRWKLSTDSPPIRPPAPAQSLDARDRDECHSTPHDADATRAPWSGSRRAGEKWRLFEYVRRAPEGTPLVKIAGDVFGADVEPGDADYQLARRFFERHSEFFKIDRRGGLVWVEPRLGLFERLNLRPQYARRKTSVRRGGDADARLDAGDAGDVDAGDKKMYAKERVNSYLSNYLVVRSEAVRRSLFSQFVTDVEGTADKWQIFERDVSWSDEHLCIPYRTRHNDAGRASKVRDRFETALQTATRRHNDAVVLTLTTDPKEHDGLHDALQSLSDNKARLMSWLSTEYQLGYRPENMSVLEFTQSGIPHYHVVLFGISWAVSQRQLAAKWRDLGQGSVVDVRGATNTHDADRWLLHDDDAGKVTLRQYLGKAIRELVDVANTSPADLRERVESGETGAWRQSLYWATERQYVTCSPSLRASSGSGDDLPHVSSWRFVGVAEYHEIPAHVRRSATFVDRPPPGAGDAGDVEPGDEIVSTSGS